MKDGEGWLLPVLNAPHRHHSARSDRAAMAMAASCCSSTCSEAPRGEHAKAGTVIWKEGNSSSANKRRHGYGGKRRKLRHLKPQKASSDVHHDAEDDAVSQRNDVSLSASFLPGLDQETALKCLAFASRTDYGCLACVSRTHLRLVKSPLLYQLRRRYGIAEQWVYMYAGGTRGWTALDPKRMLWMKVPPTKTDPSFNWSDRESLCAGTHLLWLGKEIFNFVVYKYDLIDNSWGRGPAMNRPRCLFASASCKHLAYVAGGFSEGTLEILSSAEIYDSSRGKWDPLPDMNIPRQKCSGCYMDGKFYVIGGKDANHEPITSGEEYDPISRTWRIIPDMYPTPQIQRGTSNSAPPLVAVVNDQLYAIESSINCLKVYEKRTNTWRPLGQVPVRADFHNGWGLAFRALGDELFVIGGFRDPPLLDGIAIFSWRPGPESAAPDWKLVTRRLEETGTFLYNCAVMGC